MKDAAVNPLAWLCAVIGAFFVKVPALTWLLVALMFIDTLFGVGAAVSEKDVSANAMWKGVTKKLGSLGIVVVCALVGPHVNLFGIDLVMVSTLFYMGPELLSIIRNAAIMGVPVPPELVGVMRYFQKEGKHEDPIPHDSK